jgi:hypothetical protein
MKKFLQAQRQKKIDAEKEQYNRQVASYLESKGWSPTELAQAAAPAAAAFVQAGAAHHARESEFAPAASAAASAPAPAPAPAPLTAAAFVEDDDDDSPSFIPCASFEGARSGYTFKSDQLGVGYYRDESASPQEAEFVSSTASPKPRTDLPPGVVIYNTKQWNALEISGGKVVLQMRRPDGSGGMKKRVPLSDLSAEENVAVREAVYVTNHAQRLAEPEPEPEVVLEPAPEPQANPAVALLHAKQQQREEAAAAGGSAAVPVVDSDVAVTFAEAGSLGLKFGQNAKTGAVVVKSINPGTQAEQHEELVPGLTLVALGPLIVKGMTYDETIALIKRQGRPVTCQFIRTSVAPPSPQPRQLDLEPEPEPEPAPLVEPLQLRNSPMTPDSDSEEGGSDSDDDGYELDPVVVTILQEEGLTQYVDMLEEAGLGGDLKVLVDTVRLRVRCFLARTDNTVLSFLTLAAAAAAAAAVGACRMWRV